MRYLSTVMLSVCLTSTAMAQTSAALMIRPWVDDTHGEFRAEAAFFNKGSSSGRNAPATQLQIIDAQGRAALSTTDPHLRFGAEVTYINIRSADRALPQRLVDQSFAVGLGLGEYENWQFGAVLGVGYAGDNPYADSKALYGLASLIASYRIDDRSSLQLLLDYNGNRTIFPDVPLPGIAYNRRVSDTLSYVAGLPYSSVTWEPIDRLTLHVDYTIPVTLQARASYEVVDGWHAFAAFGSRTDAFKLADDPRDHRRLFFTQRRVEAGVRWQPSERCELTLAGGYAFSQKFEDGFDVRGGETVRELSDEPFIRAGVRFQF